MHAAETLLLYCAQWDSSTLEIFVGKNQHFLYAKKLNGKYFCNIIFPLHASSDCTMVRRLGCNLQYNCNTCYNYTGLASEASHIVNSSERWLQYGYYDFTMHGYYDTK